MTVEPIATIQPTMPSMSLNKVYWVRASSEPGAFTVSCNITDFHGHTYDCEYFARESDPHGVCPLIIKWIAENPEAVEG